MTKFPFETAHAQKSNKCKTKQSLSGQPICWEDLAVVYKCERAKRCPRSTVLTLRTVGGL